MELLRLGKNVDFSSICIPMIRQNIKLNKVFFFRKMNCMLNAKSVNFGS